AEWTLWLLRNRRSIGAVQAVLHADFLVPAAIAGLRSRSGMLWVGRGDAERTLAPGREPLSRLVQRARRGLLRTRFHGVPTSPMASDLRALGIPGATVIPVPVDTARFRPPSADERAGSRAALGISGEEPVLLYVGHLLPAKGAHRLIAAAARLRE